MSNARSLEAVIIFTLLVAATCGFGLYLFPATVESIRRDVPFTYAEMGMMTGAVQVGYMTSALASGALTVRFGPLPVILVCIFVCALTLGAFALSSHVLPITACMTILGGCASAIWIPIVELIARVVPRAHRGKALGLASSGTSYGVVAISYLASMYLLSDGWRFLWLVTCGMVLLLAVVAVLRLRWLGKSEIVSNPAGDENAMTLRQRFAVLPRRLSAAVLLLMFLTGLTCTPFQTYLSSVLETEKGLPFEAVASTWWLIGMTGMAGGLAIGALADRITVRPAMMLSYGLLAAASLALLLPIEGTTVVSCAAVAFGLAFYAVFGLVPAYVAQAFPLSSTALLLAMMNVTQGVGGLLGNVAGGWGKDALGSFDLIYGITFAAAAASVVVCFVMPRETGESDRARTSDGALAHDVR